MKRRGMIFLAALALALIVACPVFAAGVSEGEVIPQSEEEVDCVTAALASGTCGDTATWELTEDGVITISGTGEMSGSVYSMGAPGTITRRILPRW
ncbi:MAG: hypothetical protein LUF00_11540 [Lachnospiraceae bacterium]|nr:hypothetical protein [Lachnospiraceae bacterium]